MVCRCGGVEWFKAIYTQAEPPDKTGFVYMLAGDIGTSNHDPYATDKSHWVQTGPHVMIVGKAAREMAVNYPNKMDPDPKHPYVMFPGNKYQHLMLPADMGSGHSSERPSPAASWPAAADFLNPNTSPTCVLSVCASLPLPNNRNYKYTP